LTNRPKFQTYFSPGPTLWIYKYQLFIYDLTIELADMIKRDRPEANLQELFDLIPVKSEFELD
jgi:hypothetical protein